MYKCDSHTSNSIISTYFLLWYVYVAMATMAKRKKNKNIEKMSPNELKFSTASKCDKYSSVASWFGLLAETSTIFDSEAKTVLGMSEPVRQNCMLKQRVENSKTFITV